MSANRWHKCYTHDNKKAFSMTSRAGKVIIETQN